MAHRNTPHYELDELSARWPHCADCGRPWPRLGDDGKCVPCEERGGAVTIVAVWLSALLVGGALLWWLVR